MKHEVYMTYKIWDNSTDTVGEQAMRTQIRDENSYVFYRDEAAYTTL